MSDLTLSGFVQHTAMGVVAGRIPFSIAIKCKEEGMARLIEARVKNFLENDNIFATAIEDIVRNKTLQGVTVAELLLMEKFALSMPQARRLLSGGGVQRKDDRGEWKIVGAPEAQVRPGWWRINRRGIIKIGPDYIIEKRLTGKGVFSKPVPVPA